MPQHSLSFRFSRMARRYLVQRPMTAWYRRFIAPRILATAPVICRPSTSFEIHALTHDRSLLETLWSLKTWYHFSGRNPGLVIYAGGPLSAAGEAILRTHFKDCRIIKFDEYKREMKVFLNNYRQCLIHSIMSSFYCARKLFGPMRFARADTVLYFDSDVLFFRAPAELLGHIDRTIPCFNSDYQNAYAFPRSLITRLLRVQLEPRVNAGLFHIAVKDLARSLERIEEYFVKVPEIDPAGWTVNRHEQTLNAILLSQAQAVRLSDNYQIGQTPLSEHTVSHHFVDDGSRPGFYRIGMRRLVSQGFLKAIDRGINASIRSEGLP